MANTITRNDSSINISKEGSRAVEAPTQSTPAPKAAKRTPITCRDVLAYLERRARVLSPSVTLVTQEAVEKAAYEEICFLFRHAREQENVGDLVAVVTGFVAKSFRDMDAAKAEAKAETLVADMKRKAETEKPRFTVSSVRASMARAEDKVDQAAKLLGILFREGDRYSDLEGRDIAAAILNGFDCKPVDLPILLMRSSEPARIRQLITLCRGRSISADLMMAADEAVRALILDADWPLGRAAALLEVFLEDADGHHAFVEGDTLAKAVKEALESRIKDAVCGAETADEAVEKANSVFYCMSNPLYLGFSDEVVNATYDLLVARLVALGSTLSDAEVTARNCRDNPSDSRKRGRKQSERRQAQDEPKAEAIEPVASRKVTQEEIRARLQTITGAIADAEQVDEEAKTRREMAERGNPCRSLEDLKAEKAQASTAKGPGSISKPLADDRRARVEKAFAEAKETEATARDAVRFESALPDNEKSKEHYHRFVSELQAAKTERLRIQKLLETDARLRKEDALKAEQAMRAAAAAKPKDEKKSEGKDKRHQRPERERHANA